MPYLMYLAAYRLRSDPNLAIDMDVINQAYERTYLNDPPPNEGGDVCQEVSLTRPTLPDSEDPFEVEMRGRLKTLADTTRGVRRLERLRSLLDELESTFPVTAATRAWLQAANEALQLVGNESRGDDDPPDMVDVETSTAVQDLVSALDGVDECVKQVVDLVRGAGDPLAKSLTEKYKWLRGNACLLGVQCTSSTRCPVCLVNQVSRFNDPCGHTMCTACMAKVSETECHMCREPIRARRRLFGSY